MACISLVPDFLLDLMEQLYAISELVHESDLSEEEFHEEGPQSLDGILFFLIVKVLAEEGNC